MRLKINNQYFADAEGNPVEFDSALKLTSQAMVKLFVNYECIVTFGGIPNLDAYTLEGGDWTPEPATERDQILAEADANAYELFLALQGE